MADDGGEARSLVSRWRGGKVRVHARQGKERLGDFVNFFAGELLPFLVLDDVIKELFIPDAVNAARGAPVGVYGEAGCLPKDGTTDHGPRDHKRKAEGARREAKSRRRRYRWPPLPCPSPPRRRRGEWVFGGDTQGGDRGAVLP